MRPTTWDRRLPLELNSPSKTFLVGEYLALYGGPAILIATRPEFSMQINLSRENQDCPFHVQSPAGKLWLSRQNDISKYQLDFYDPYSGGGGLGASGAQFLFVFQFLQFLDKGSEGDCESAWRGFRDFSRVESGLAPSGADIVAQMVGGLTHFEFELNSQRFLARGKLEGSLNETRFSDRAPSEAFPDDRGWPFPCLAFTLLRTGKKLATHDHLHSQGNIGNIGDLRKLVNGVIKSIQESNEANFIEGINDYGRTLSQRGLLAEESAELIGNLKGELGSELLGIKGCGALGADILLLLHHADARPRIFEVAKITSLSIVGSNLDLSSGFNWKGPNL